jgi:hypothetical protein
MSRKRRVLGAVLKAKVALRAGASVTRGTHAIDSVVSAKNDA